MGRPASRRPGCRRFAVTTSSCSKLPDGPKVPRTPTATVAAAAREMQSAHASLLGSLGEGQAMLAACVAARDEAAARAAGIDYVAIPVTHAGFSEGQVTAMVAALSGTDQPVLAYCRSGTRSTLLWALAQASEGRNPDDLSAAAAEAGYDLTPIRAMLDMLAARKA